uniref:Uncharacterized protein n=1 Tax=Triticum urartu TaxID=4572 RepID=A0A8R7QMI7_TRIUA
MVLLIFRGEEADASVGKYSSVFNHFTASIQFSTFCSFLHPFS